MIGPVRRVRLTDYARVGRVGYIEHVDASASTAHIGMSAGNADTSSPAGCVDTAEDRWGWWIRDVHDESATTPATNEGQASHHHDIVGEATLAWEHDSSNRGGSQGIRNIHHGEAGNEIRHIDIVSGDRQALGVTGSVDARHDLGSARVRNIDDLEPG
jgi:hypothetical protein